MWLSYWAQSHQIFQVYSDFMKRVNSNSLLMNRRKCHWRGYRHFLASVLLKDKMIFLTISNSIPHVNGVSRNEHARSIALEILFNVTYTKDSSHSSPSNLKLSLAPSPQTPEEFYRGMKGMKIETSASCLSGHFRSAADRTATRNGIFLEDFSRDTHVLCGRISNRRVLCPRRRRCAVMWYICANMVSMWTRQVNAHLVRRYLRKA